MPDLTPDERLRVTYDRDVLTTVLVYHYRAGIKGCGCGWSELGCSWPAHVADVYEQSVLACSPEGGETDGTHRNDA